jgi:hypothetical protein
MTPQATFFLALRFDFHPGAASAVLDNLQRAMAVP